MGRAINKTVTIVELIKENCWSSPNHNNSIHRHNRHMGTPGGRTPNTNIGMPTMGTNCRYQLTRSRCLQSLTMKERDLLLPEEESLIDQFLSGNPQPLLFECALDKPSS
ncbi:hypothetical protein OROGR_032770 [Orobanche gracilis]